MELQWKPSIWGQRFTGSGDWTLRLSNNRIELSARGMLHVAPIEGSSPLRIHHGLFWTDLTLFYGEHFAVKVDGIPNKQARTIAAAVDSVIALYEIEAKRRAEEERRALRRARFHNALAEIQMWRRSMSAVLGRANTEHLWLTYENVRGFIDSKPGLAISTEELKDLLADQDVQSSLNEHLKDAQTALALWDADLHSAAKRRNETHTVSELAACKNLFEQVESQPLTTEQARAVVCFDNRVQVVASAGSGKTSTMVAKAAYAIHRKIAAPERIVLLAFNKQAAEELKERAAKSFERLGMEGVSVKASTFHSLGLSIIGEATGEKPDIPEWAIDSRAGLQKLADIIDRLKDRSQAFRVRWDLFRFVFGRDLPAFGSKGVVDTWDAQGDERLLTSQGESVRSQEEAMIANWLFLNGVNYRYEERYKFKTVDKDHRQYKPDFYYPDIDLYHEHFALDAQGQAPPHFISYLDGVRWKRQLHRDKGTSLFETTSHGLRSGTDFQRLESELASRGVVLDPNPDRKIPDGGQRPMEASELTGLIRTFISHAKSNCLSIEAMRRRLDAMPKTAFKLRHKMFLDLAEPIYESWDAALAAEGGIDFEDMLNLAAEHLESGRYDAPFDLVMADEFQDASRARARLCRALVQKPGRFLFAVGDDWQSINRFAGADVSVMTGFRKWFGHGQVLKLEQTFRCPQALCDVSSAFVSKNPIQIPKRVQSVAPAAGPVLQAFQVDSDGLIADAVEEFVMKLAEGVQNGTIAPGRKGKISIYVLGRYNDDRKYVPTRPSRFNRHVDIAFLSIHRSKGSEADYVILPKMISPLRGRSFPSNRADDPVLALAMPDGDDYPLSEERRLFYVALTRARRSVVMFTARGQCSTFLRELEKEGSVVITDIDGKAIKDENCPWCKQGVLIARSGRYGEFRSCSNYPACAYKPKQQRSGSRPRGTKRSPRSLS